MDVLATWIAPPVVGAAIGAFTNWLAIKMLFRPYEEIRFLGLRLPFTPGILPRERNRLARSLGRTVSADLITEDAVRRRLAEPDIRESLCGGIDERLAEALSGRAAGLVPTLLRAGKEAKGVFGEVAAAAWARFGSSDAFRAALAASARAALAQAGDLPLARLVPPETAREIASLVLSPEGIERLRARLSALVLEAYEGGIPGSGTPREPLLPPEAFAPFLEAATEGLYAASLPAIESFLREPQTRSSLERYALDIVRRAIERMTPLQRLIVSAAQYERDLARAMPQTVEDLLEAAMGMLRASATARGASAAVGAAFRRAAEEGLAASLRALVPRRAAMATVDAAMDALAVGGPAAAERLSRAVADRPEATVAGLLDALGLPAEALAERAAEAAARALRGASEAAGDSQSTIASTAASAFASFLGEALGDESAAQAFGITEELRYRLSAALADRALSLLDSEAGRIVAGLDIGRIVSERIDELDMAEAERMVLDVAGRELTWITILGGVLGGAIGLAQSLLIALRAG